MVLYRSELAGRRERQVSTTCPAARLEADHLYRSDRRMELQKIDVFPRRLGGWQSIFDASRFRCVGVANSSGDKRFAGSFAFRRSRYCCPFQLWGTSYRLRASRPCRHHRCRHMPLYQSLSMDCSKQAAETRAVERCLSVARTGSKGRPLVRSPIGPGT
jgi:hypothetical protein